MIEFSPILHSVNVFPFSRCLPPAMSLCSSRGTPSMSKILSLMLWIESEGSTSKVKVFPVKVLINICIMMLSFRFLFDIIMFFMILLQMIYSDCVWSTLIKISANQFLYPHKNIILKLILKRESLEGWTPSEVNKKHASSLWSFSFNRGFLKVFLCGVRDRHRNFKFRSWHLSVRSGMVLIWKNKLLFFCSDDNDEIMFPFKRNFFLFNK